MCGMMRSSGLIGIFNYAVRKFAIEKSFIPRKVKVKKREVKVKTKILKELSY